MLRRSTLLVLLLLLVAAAWAQTPADEETPPVEDAAEAAPADPEAPQTDPEALADDAAEDPLAAIEAVEAAGADVDGEAMDRFEPSERISEDSSVAYPNDI